MALLQNLWSDFLEKLISYIPKLISIVVILVIGYVVIRVLVRGIEKFFEKANFDRGIETFIENIVKVVLWAIFLVVILANLGVNVTGLVAGLGIMGFIVGFALKDILANLAAGVFILFHKPFKVGDWIKIGGVVGGVERMGIAACVLKSPDNTKITIPNSKIWGGVIQNFSGNPTRKMRNLEVGISYDSNIDKAIKIINNILKNDKRVLKDPKPQIVVTSLGDSSVNISVRPSMKKDDYWSVYFDSIKKIKEEFDKNGITIPFPQTDDWIKEMSKSKKKRV